MTTASEPTAAAPAGASITVGDAYRFFVPLMLMAELMMISHAVIAAFLARMPNPEPILAAYSVAFALHATLGSPVWACQIVFLSFVRDRAAVRRLFVFGLQSFAAVAWFWLLLSLTPLGDVFLQELFGLSPAVADAAKLCLFISLWIPPTSLLRSLAYALLMSERKTIYVTIGTIIRLAALAGILAMLTSHLTGAVVGIIALAGCITVETVVALVVAYPAWKRLEPTGKPVPGYRELWRFSWPIMMMQTAESGIALTANFFLGRLPRPELALAAFGVTESIMRVLLSPLRNLIHTTQTLVKSRADARVIVIFGAHTTVIFGGLTLLLFHVPALRELVLFDVMGLPEHMAVYITDALRISVVLALGMAAAGLSRGLLIASRHTGAIAASSVLRVFAVVVVGVSGMALGAENGAMIGMLALILAFAAEAALLGWRLFQLDRAGPPLFTRPHTSA